MNIKVPLSNNGYKLPKIIWQPGSIEGLSALCYSPSVTHIHRCIHKHNTHTVTAACICSHLLFIPTLLRFISLKGDLVGHADNSPPLTALPHKLPGGIGTVTGSFLVPWALGRGAEVEVYVCVCSGFRAV